MVMHHATCELCLGPGRWYVLCLYAAYGRGLVTCDNGEVRPWIAMQLLGCSLESLIGGHGLCKHSTFFRFANQMLTVRSSRMSRCTSPQEPALTSTMQSSSNTFDSRFLHRRLCSTLITAASCTEMSSQVREAVS
jgi:hypothetical protein